MTLEELNVIINAQTAQFRKELNQVQNQVNSLTSNVNKKVASIKNIFSRLGKFLAVLGIGKILKDSITSAMDSIESESLVGTVFGGMTKDIQDWSNNLQETLGLNAYSVRKNAATLFNMSKSLGMTGDSALGVSKDLTLLAEDMASFYNISSDEAFTKIRSGITGETEPLKQLGIMIDENTLKQYGYSQSMTNSEKVMVRYKAIMAQTSAAHGDLARTIDSPANQVRILKNNLQMLSIELGRAFMPILTTVLPILNSFIQGLTRTMSVVSSFMNTLFGKSGSASSGAGSLGASMYSAANGAGALSSNLGTAGSNAKKAAKEAKGLLSGFDEINNIGRPDNNNSGDGTAALAAGRGGGINLTPSVDTSETETTFSALADKIRTWLKSIDFGPIQDSFNRLKEAAEPIITIIGGNIKWFLTEILKPLAEWTVQDAVPAFLNLLSGALDFLNPILRNFQTVGQWLWDNFLQPIANWTGGVAINILNGIADGLSVIGDWISKHKTLVDDFAIVVGSVAAAFGLVKLAIVLPTALLTAWNVIAGIGTAVTTALGAAFAFITSPIGIVVAAIGAVIAIVVLCIKHWDDIKKVAINVWDKIKEIAGNIKDKFTDVFSIITTKWENFKTSISNGISTVISKFKDFGTKVGDFFSNAFKSVVNGALSWVESKINGFISSINGAISFINKIPGVNIGKLSYVSLPRLAKGGIVDSATIAMIGERGKEAVVPLERNTEWIDKMAEKLAKNIVINNGISGDRDLYLELHVGDAKFGKACARAINKAQLQEGRILLEL